MNSGQLSLRPGLMLPDRPVPRLRRGWRDRSASIELVSPSSLIYRQRFGLIFGPLRDHGRVDIEGCGDHRGRRARQPVGQGDILEIGTPEYLEVLQLGVGEVLDIMTSVAFDNGDVARVEVLGLRFGAGSEHPDLRPTFDEICPFIGIGVPMQLAQATRDQSDERRGDVWVGEEVPAVGNLHRTAGTLAIKRFVFYTF